MFNAAFQGRHTSRSLTVPQTCACANIFNAAHFLSRCKQVSGLILLGLMKWARLSAVGSSYLTPLVAKITRMSWSVKNSILKLSNHFMTHLLRVVLNCNCVVYLKSVWNGNSPILNACYWSYCEQFIHATFYWIFFWPVNLKQSLSF